MIQLMFHYLLLMAMMILCSGEGVVLCSLVICDVFSPSMLSGMLLGGKAVAYDVAGHLRA